MTTITRIPALKYQIFVPVVHNEPNSLKGVGLTTSNVMDVRLTGSSWYYTWGTGDLGDSRCVPMDFTGKEYRLPSGYDGYALLFNEPENNNQANLGPVEAARRYKDFLIRYPQAKVIIGNVGLWGQIWTLGFQWELIQMGLPRPAGWGVHGYVEGDFTPQQITDYWDWFKSEIVARGEELWITEFGDVYGRVVQLEKLIKWANANANRYAIFANRIDDDASWYPNSWPHPNLMQLVDNYGELTELGKWYRDW